MKVHHSLATYHGGAADMNKRCAMWLPTFLQRGIHFFGERTEVLAFDNFVLFESCPSAYDRKARGPWPRRITVCARGPWLRVWPPRAWVTRLAALTAKHKTRQAPSTTKTKRIDARKFTADRRPQWGHLKAEREICFPQSGQGLSSI